jgi:ABC-type Zn uptake system ZnuABC Zn-binding protein ZnuA
MKPKLVYTLLFAVLAAVMPAHAAKIRVVTPLTDLADLTRNVGGDHVEVVSLATGV